MKTTCPCSHVTTFASPADFARLLRPCPQAFRWALTLLLLGWCLPHAGFGAPPPQFAVEDVLTGIKQPISLRFLPDGRLLVLQKEGRILIADVSTVPAQFQLYLDLGSAAHPHGIIFDQERGLLDIAIDPAFPSSPYIYLLYTPATGPNGPRTRVSRFTHVANSGGLTSRASPGSEVILWQETDGYDSCCHFGGAVDFGPDGRLWITVGDHFQGSYASSLEHAGGKVHRINKNGTIPADNPYADGAGPNVDSTFAIGLRNPFRARWDLVGNRFYIAEVGGNTQSVAWEDLHVIDYDPVTQSFVDEDYGTAQDNHTYDGINFGWPTVEGLPPHTHFPGAVIDPVVGEPIFAYRHNGESSAINGGVAYRGSQFPASYAGVYFYADSTRDFIRYLRFAADGSVIPNPNPDPPSLDVPDQISYTFDLEPVGRVVALDVGPDGSLYMVSFTDSGAAKGPNPSTLGAVRRYVYDGGNNRPVISDFAVTPTSGASPLNAMFSFRASDPDNHPMTYVLDFGDGTSTSPTPLAPNTLVTIPHTYSADGSYRPRLLVSDPTHTSSEEKVLPVGTPPTITSLVSSNSRPGASGTSFRFGDTITFSATATDTEDGPLTGAHFTWSVDFVRPDNTHPAFGPTSNATSINFLIPSQGQGFSGPVYYRCYLAVTDSSGLTASSFIDIFPEKANITFNTVPSGIVVQVDGNTAQATPFTMDTLINFSSVITVLDERCLNGTRYVFSQWSNGPTTAQQVYTVPPTDSTLTATFTNSGPCVGPPTDGLVMHLKSDVGLVVNGSTVTAWEDQSGNNNVLSAVGGPSRILNALNQQPIVHFDGVDDALARSGFVGLPEGSADRSVFMVVRYNSLGSGNGWAGFAYGATQNNKVFGVTLTPSGALGVQGWGAANDITSTATTGNLGEWMVQGAVYSGGVVTQYKNNQLIGTKTHAFATAPGGVRLGEELNGGRNLNMDVAEVLVYNRALSVQERQLAFDYVQTRYAIGSAPNTPPVVTIVSPPNGSSYTLAQMPITFTATATDTQDGNVSASIVWTSNLSGRLGDGASINVSLPVGTHVITAEAVDSALAAGTADVSVIVNENTPPAGSLPTAGLVVHLESDLNVSMQSGNTVAGWLDQSGMGNDLLAGGNPQLISAGTPAGRPALRLDGNDKLERLHASAPLGGLPTGNANRTLVVVGRYVSSTAWAGVAYGNGANNQGFGSIVKHPTGELVLHGWGSGNDLVTTTPGLGAGWMITTATLNNSVGTLHKDNVQIGQWTHTYATALNRLSIGAEIKSLGYVAMDVAAVLIYNRALNATERGQVDAYLRNKYIASAPGNTAPAVTITAPPNNSSYPAGTAITFDGTASDTTDGNLSSSISWSSNLSGALGTGASVTTSTLAVGTHTITASVVDSGGLPGSATRTVTVTANDAIAPTSVIPLFNGQALSGVSPWFSTSGASDPNGVFQVSNGLLHVSGNAWGALMTNARYRDYKMVLEFKWGSQTFSPRQGKAKDGGVCIHSNGVEGGWSGLLMPSLQVQVMDGSLGDLLLLKGNDASGNPVPMSFNSAVNQVTCTSSNWNCRGGYRWNTGGNALTLSDDLGTVHWSGWDPGWQDVAGYRGQTVVESPDGEWNQLVVIASGSTVQVYLNGTKINEATNVTPSAGKIQLEVEWAEYFVRRWELHPLAAAVGPAIVTAALPGATQHSSYSKTLQAVGGTTPYTWSVASGALPSGVSLNVNTGALSGTPTAAGTFPVSLRATDASGLTSTQPYSLVVTASSGGATPPVTAGLVLHLDASQGVTTNGSTVTSWSDLSGRNNHLTAGGNPQLTPSGTPAGRPAISLDGNDKLERLHASAPLNGLPTGNANRTVFLVARYTAAASSAGFAYGNGANNQAFGVIVRDSNGALTLQGWGSSHDLVSTTAGVGAGWLVQAGMVEGSAGKLFKNGSQIGQKSKTYNTVLNRIVIGQEIAQLGYVTMDVAAVLLYDRALNTTERNAVQAYLQSRYLTAP